MQPSDSLKFATQTFGDRLRELSSQRGTYSEVARDLGINRQQFARYLNGSSRPRDALVRKMAEYFEVESGVFFQSRPVSELGKPAEPSGNPTVNAFVELLGQVNPERVSDDDLRPGFYLQYKQSLMQLDKLSCILWRIYRDADGVMRHKRRYSVLSAKDAPGIEVWHVSHGIFFKNCGALVNVERNAASGDFVVSSYKVASNFAVADRVRTGILTTHGHPGNIGPMASRSVLERVPDGESVLTWARRQGFRPMSEAPDYIQYYFTGPDSLPESAFGLR